MDRAGSYRSYGFVSPSSVTHGLDEQVVDAASDGGRVLALRALRDHRLVVEQAPHRLDARVLRVLLVQLPQRLDNGVCAVQFKDALPGRPFASAEALHQP